MCTFSNGGEGSVAINIRAIDHLIIHWPTLSIVLEATQIK
jgi:hypothetical protein